MKPSMAITYVLALILAASGIAANARPCSAYVLDRIDAVVNGRVITKSEVDKAVEVESLSGGAKTGKTVQELRKEALDSMIDRILILEEARKFNIVTVTDEEVEKAYESIKKGFSSDTEFEKALKKDEITTDELKDNLRDQILALKYIDRRIKFFIRVGLDEQKKYYEDNKDKFGGKGFDEVHDQIYDLLVEKETGRKLEEYIKELRSKAKITIYHD
jgi:parvulin-like peptidyl-prolyl isomerase